MKKKFILAITLFLFSPFLVKAQYYNQYFDGADTLSENSIFIDYGNDTLNNIWQIGKPQKTLFDTAASIPNVIITDTINYYPANDTSSFQVHFDSDYFWDMAGVFAFQWQQKLDYDSLFSGGKVEFSVDSGQTWENIIESPYTYNFYGYDSINIDTLSNGEFVFTGTDTVWRNIWYCLDRSYVSLTDRIDFKFTSISDTLNDNKEGWMIDDMIFQITMVHTLKELEQEEYIKVYPNPSTNKLHINIQNQEGFHIIENMQVLNLVGELIEEYNNIPTKFFIETKDYKSGTYLLKIKTNLKTKTAKFTVAH